MAKNVLDRAERRRSQAVACAAAATRGGGAALSDAETESRRRFLSVVASIVLLGSLTVAYAWLDRQYDHPTVLDSWRNAYAVFDCQTESWLAPFDSRANPDGIRSRGDGIIYIEPATEAVAGDSATIAVFLDAVGAELTDERLRLPDGSELAERTTFCDGEEAVLQIRRWAPGQAEPHEVRWTDLAATRFEADRESLAIVFAPTNSTVPLPPAAAELPNRTDSGDDEATSAATSILTAEEDHS